MKYIYFEIYSVEGFTGPRLQNENILVIKPSIITNEWGFMKRIKNESGKITDQNWVDLEKYELIKKELFEMTGFVHFEDYDKWVKLCIEKLNSKLREIKLEKILHE